VIAELSGRKDIQKMQLVWSEFSLYFSILGIWTGFFLFQMGETLSLIFFSEKFRESGTIMAYSGFFLVFNLLSQINFQILAGTGRVKDRIRILLIILPINIVLNLICIQLL
jgi:O-antigen/teichoic acid export membrane protein